MTTKVIIDKAQGAAFIMRAGHIKLGEMVEGTKELESDFSFRNIRKALSDLSAADMSSISTDEFESYSHYCQKTLKGLKIAIVAPSDLSFGIARMLEILSDVEDIMVFRKMSEALLWLDVFLPEDY